MRTRLFPILLFVMLIFGQPDISAAPKSDKLKPKWVTHELPESQSRSYFFVRAHGTGNSLESARQQAFVAMSQKLERERGLTVNTNLKIKEQITQTQSSTDSEYHQEITLDVTEAGRQVRIVCREIDDYWVCRDGKYDTDILYTVTDKKMSGLTADDITVTTRYGAAGLLSIIPSVGQFYKGSNLKGGLILGGEILAAGAIVFCENTRASYVKKMQEQPKHAEEYNSLADSWEVGRNISIGAAAAIYVYNLIDALVAPGAKRVVVKNKSISISAIPYVDNQSIGAGLALKF